MKKFDVKKLLSAVSLIPKYTAFSFSMSMIIFMTIGFFLGEEAMQLKMIIQLLALCTVSAVLQLVAFSELFFDKMAYTKRMCVFMFPFLVVIIGFAMLFGWFPMENIGAWITFITIFLLCFVISLVIFEIHFKITGNKYTGVLNEYKKKRDVSSNPRR